MDRQTQGALTEELCELPCYASFLDMESIEQKIIVDGYHYKGTANQNRDVFTLYGVREQISAGAELEDQNGMKYKVRESSQTIDGRAILVVVPA